MVSPLCLVRGSTLNCQYVSRGARPRHSLVADEDVKNTNKQTNQTMCKLLELYHDFPEK